MKTSERLAADYLRHCGFQLVEFEPEGASKPPDFLVDRRVAVEVRRLNQNHDDGDGLKGLEEVAIRFRDRFQKFVRSLGPPKTGRSWFVCYDFSRPLPDWNKLRPMVKRALTPFMSEAGPVSAEEDLGDGFKLQVFPSSKVQSTCFVLGGYTDEQSGGWLLEEMAKNLEHCIAEKTLKMAAVRHKYAEWWLVLIDHISYGADEFDQASFHQHVSIQHTFDKVILLDPQNHTHAFEL